MTHQQHPKLDYSIFTSFHGIQNRLCVSRAPLRSIIMRCHLDHKAATGVEIFIHSELIAKSWLFLQDKLWIAYHLYVSSDGFKTVVKTFMTTSQINNMPSWIIQYSLPFTEFRIAYVSARRLDHHALSLWPQSGQRRELSTKSAVILPNSPNHWRI